MTVSEPATSVGTNGPIEAVAECLNDPAVAASLVTLLDNAELLSTLAADRVLGQPTFAANGENRWDAVRADTLCWPYGLCLHDGRLAVADSGNNRVVVWSVP